MNKNKCSEWYTKYEDRITTFPSKPQESTQLIVPTIILEQVTHSQDIRSSAPLKASPSQALYVGSYF